MQLELFHAVYVIGGWPHPHRAAAGQAGRIKGSSGSTAQRQQPSSRAAMCYFFILAMSKHGFKKAEGNLPCCLTVPIARTGLQVGQVCSNLISSCCPKEGLMLHRRSGGERVVKKMKAWQSLWGELWSWLNISSAPESPEPVAEDVSIHPALFHWVLNDPRFQIFPIWSTETVPMLYRRLIFTTASSGNGWPWDFSTF